MLNRRKTLQYLRGKENDKTTSGELLARANTNVTCNRVQVVGILTTHQPYPPRADLLVTKLHGLETLFFSTAVGGRACRRLPIYRINRIDSVYFIDNMTFMRDSRLRLRH